MKFCSSPTNCLWPIYLEKAAAKVYGSYWSLGGGGQTDTILKDLTGAPTERFKTEDHSEKELFEIIHAAD
jgi:hypothetical protein